MQATTFDLSTDKRKTFFEKEKNLKKKNLFLFQKKK